MKHASRNTAAIQRFARSSWPLIAVIGVVVALHIPHITSPPLDQHAWRQTDTASVARNFFEESPNILYPRVDMREQFSGITGMEFPLYNFLLFLGNLVFGQALWHGRVLTLLFSVVGLGYFLALLKLRYNKTTALIGTVALASWPLWFYFSRNIQPDIAMVAASIMSLYYGQRFNRTPSTPLFAAAAGSLSVACLFKIPASLVALPLAVTLGFAGYRYIISHWRTCLTILLAAALPPVAWYIWSSHLSATYGLGQYYYGELSLHQSLVLAVSRGFWKTLQSYVLPFNAITAVLYATLGLGLLHTYAKRDWLPLAWLSAIVLFLAVFANKSFYHNYYSLPLIPPLALIGAAGIQRMWTVIRNESRLAALLYVIALAAIWSHVGYTASAVGYHLTNPEYVRLEGVMTKVSQPTDRILTNNGGNPIMLVLAHRKGWSLSETDFSYNSLAQLHRGGAQFLVRDKHFNWVYPLDLPGGELVYQDSDFAIYRMVAH